jgi:tetratricopeptide (TPR) repeat protein
LVNNDRASVAVVSVSFAATADANAVASMLTGGGPPPPPPRRPDGISLAGLRAFVDAHGGRAAFVGKSTKDVKWSIVVPETKAAGTSYADLLRARGGANAAQVGPASAFVSHVYSYEFLDVFDAIEAWEEQQLFRASGGTVLPHRQRKVHAHPLEVLVADDRCCSICGIDGGDIEWHSCNACDYGECPSCFAESERIASLPRVPPAVESAVAPAFFYYFDLLVVNQHGQTAAVAPDVLWREFTGGVRAIGRTLLVLTLDASEKGALTRAWCVAEIVAGLQIGGSSDKAPGEGADRSAAAFEVIMSPAEEAKFHAELTGDFDKLVYRTCNVDLERCHAYHGDECLEGGVCRDVSADRVVRCSNDLAFVLDNVRRELPFAEANKRVIACMRGWMVQAARERLTGIADPDERAGSSLQYYLARLLKDCGRLSEAEPLLREQVEVRRRVVGDAHPNTLASISNLGQLLQARGDLDGAEPLLREALAVSRRTLGDAHPSTLVSINYLGLLLQGRGDLAGAEQLLREALEARRRTLGDTHPDTLPSINSLGLLLQDRGDLDGAEPLFREGLAASRRTLGDAHPSTLVYINNLGRLLKARGDLDGAEPLFREGLAASRRTLGDAHPHTLVYLGNLGQLLH